MKQRLSRVNEVLQRELGSLLLREFTFVAKLVTVQQVDVTPDLKKAHVYISVIGTLEERHAVMAQLHDKRAVLQAELSKRVVLKYTPHLHFILDAAVERGTRVLGILEELGLPEPAENTTTVGAEEANEDEENDDHEEVLEEKPVLPRQPPAPASASARKGRRP